MKHPFNSVDVFRAYGDSVTVGVAATPNTLGYAYLLQSAIGSPISNFAVSGDMVPDQTPKVYLNNPSFGAISSIMLGINDERIYGVNATTLGYYRRGLQALIAYLGLGNKRFGVTSGVYTGTWVNTPVYGLGKSSNTLGSTATFIVNGTVVYLGMIQQDSAPGTFDVTIDGSPAGSFATSTGSALVTANGVTFGAMLLRFPGLASGTHTVVVTVTSATSAPNKVYVDWVAGNAQSVYPKVYVGNVLYAQAYSAGGSAANVDSYNATITSLVSDLQTDGLNITPVNVNNLNLSVDMDGAYHPVNSGHVKIANSFLSAFV